MHKKFAFKVTKNSLRIQAEKWISIVCHINWHIMFAVKPKGICSYNHISLNSTRNRNSLPCSQSSCDGAKNLCRNAFCNISKVYSIYLSISATFVQFIYKYVSKFLLNKSHISEYEIYCSLLK